MDALIMMLKNQKEKTFHPIFYFEDPFPFSENSHKIKRFKSKAHRTIGFINRNDALNCIETEITKIIESNYLCNNIIKDLEKDIIWNGEDIPANIQIR